MASYLPFAYGSRAQCKDHVVKGLSARQYWNIPRTTMPLNTLVTHTDAILTVPVSSMLLTKNCQYSQGNVANITVNVYPYQLPNFLHLSRLSRIPSYMRHMLSFLMQSITYLQTLNRTPSLFRECNSKYGFRKYQRISTLWLGTSPMAKLPSNISKCWCVYARVSNASL